MEMLEAGNEPDIILALQKFKNECPQFVPSKVGVSVHLSTPVPLWVIAE
jgi:hypothetical protein